MTTFKSSSQSLEESVNNPLPYGADKFLGTDEDANGNPQTLTYYKNDVVIQVCELEYNADNICISFIQTMTI